MADRVLTYTVLEFGDRRTFVGYEATVGRRKAFKFLIKGTSRSLHDTWPLRREIAKHAGVDPDQVVPDWDHDVARGAYERYAPRVWHVRLDANQIPGQTALGDEEDSA